MTGRLARMMMLSCALALALPLAACGGGGGGDDDGASPPARPKQVLDCPKVQTLTGTERLLDFLPGRTDAGAEIVDARITGVAGNCALRHRDTARVTFQIGFAAKPGPALDAKDAAHYALPYFVALVRGDTVIQKSFYTQDVHFRPDLGVVPATSKRIAIEVPNGAAGAGIEVLVGFALTPAELAAAGLPAPP